MGNFAVSSFAVKSRDLALCAVKAAMARGASKNELTQLRAAYYAAVDRCHASR